MEFLKRGFVCNHAVELDLGQIDNLFHLLEDVLALLLGWVGALIGVSPTKLYFPRRLDVLLTSYSLMLFLIVAVMELLLRPSLMASPKVILSPFATILFDFSTRRCKSLMLFCTLSMVG